MKRITGAEEAEPISGVKIKRSVGNVLTMGRSSVQLGGSSRLKWEYELGTGMKNYSPDI